MSNDVKTKEKIDMDPAYIIKLTVTLLITCVVVAAVCKALEKAPSLIKRMPA